MLDQGECRGMRQVHDEGPGTSGVSVTEVTAMSATMDASIVPNGAAASVCFSTAANGE